MGRSSGPQRLLRGVPAAPGMAFGLTHRLDAPLPDAGETVPEEAREGERERALAALEAAAGQLDALATRLTGQESEIVATGALLARDPALLEAVEQAVAAGRPAPAALVEAADALAAPLRELDDPTFALRADDLGSVGRRAARLAVGAPAVDRPAAAGRTVLVATDLGPADVAELDASVAGVALGAGGVTSHAAIVARSLGLPMVVGLGADLAGIEDGTPVLVDGGRGRFVAAPPEEEIAAAERDLQTRADALRRAAAERDLPAATRDGRRVRVLANVSSRVEVEAALAAGAEGVGLLRTELAFLEAKGWPTRGEHERTLRPILSALTGRLATVRLLDFGGDKTPPFLRGESGRGIELLLAAPDALAAQVEAVAAAGGGVELRVLVPMVTEPGQLGAVRDLLAGTGVVGPMVEVPAAATLADQLAAVAGFLSVGTNDLASLELGRGRDSSAPAPAHHPAVLRRIAAVVVAAHAAGIPVEVCGEAASDPRALPLLVGLDVDELSVGAARVGEVRAAVRAMDYARVRDLAAKAVDATSALEVERLLAEPR
ncbi:MAG TPA: putative PEP-binding protein [Terriglobales bacterium]|nr:putative PEP-binding protein [Terriglobales bacterium]